MAKNINIKGLDKLIKDIASLGNEGIKVLAQTTEANAREIEANAKKYAPFDLSKLRQGIKAYEVNKTKWKIQANYTGLAPYSAYMEFGTGGLVDVPEELKDVAIQFRGKGERQVNILPRPYLYPAFVQGRLQYIKDLEADLEDLTKKV